MPQPLKLSEFAPTPNSDESGEEQSRRLTAACLAVEDYCDPQRLEMLEALLEMPDPQAASAEAALKNAQQAADSVALLDDEVQRFLSLTDRATTAGQPENG